MGILGFAKDMFNGFTPSRKKRYSPFLSAVLLHLSEFKIEELEEFGGKAAISEAKNGLDYFVSVEKNNKKIDELRTTVFEYINEKTLNQITLIKPLKEDLLFSDYTARLRRRSYSDESNFVDLISKRSYVKYLDEAYGLGYLRGFMNQGNRKTERFSIYNILSFNNDPLFGIDSRIKKMDVTERSYLAIAQQDLTSFSNWDSHLNNKQKQYEAVGGYKYKDVWYIKLSVKKGQTVLFEEIVLCDGMNGNNLYMHEDDFIHFSNALDTVFRRWNNHKG